MYYEPSTQKEYASIDAFKLEYPNTSFGDLLLESDRNSAGIYWIMDTAPNHNPHFEIAVPDGIVQTESGYARSYKIEPKPMTESERVAITTELVAQKIEALWKAADSYTSGFISGVAVGLLTIGVMQQKPKALAIKAWSSSIWAEYYNRKSTVTVDSIDNHDFSSFGPIPYTVPELEAEVGT